MVSILVLLIFIFFKYVFIRVPKGSTDQFGETSREGGKQLSGTKKVIAIWKSVYKPACLMIATFTYPHTMTILGFTFTTSLFLFVLLWIFGTKRISAILAISVGFPLCLFFMMTFYLKITLPPFTLADLPLGF
jgi:hypothetical protein